MGKSPGHPPRDGAGTLRPEAARSVGGTATPCARPSRVAGQPNVRHGACVKLVEVVTVVAVPPTDVSSHFIAAPWRPLLPGAATSGVRTHGVVRQITPWVGIAASRILRRWYRGQAGHATPGRPDHRPDHLPHHHGSKRLFAAVRRFRHRQRRTSNGPSVSKDATYGAHVGATEDFWVSAQQ